MAPFYLLPHNVGRSLMVGSAGSARERPVLTFREPRLTTAKAAGSGLHPIFGKLARMKGA